MGTRGVGHVADSTIEYDSVWHAECSPVGRLIVQCRVNL
jgi:hypothetical protein